MKTEGTQPSLVWYAAYGSNICEERFLCYIRGGTPPGAHKDYVGCHDPSLPRDARPIMIPHGLFFAGSASGWNGKGMAFIRSERDRRSFGRMYLITFTQFDQLIQQEQGRKNPLGTPICPPLSYITSHEFCFTNPANPTAPADPKKRLSYGRILNLGSEDGHPVVTFTAVGPDNDIVPAEPAREYLQTIARGIRETFPDVSVQQISQYFSNCDGVRGNIVSEELNRWLSEGNAGLFPDGNVTVIGLPPNFDILKKLEQAASIRLAMAFCHMSGWARLELAVKKCKGSVRLMTGLEFCQTEPALLRAWNRLSVSPNFRPRVMTSESAFFHPKVIVVSAPGEKFALVGSGNLSEGGLRTNIECFAYIADEGQVGTLAKWFDDLFDQKAQEFGEDYIRAYEPKYKTAHRALAKIHRQQRSVERTLIVRNAAFLARWREAVSQAKQWFNKPDFNDGWQKRKVAVDRMKQLLHYPTFDFSRPEWSEFYRVLELGHLIAVYRDRVFRQEKRLKEALRLLVDDAKPIQERLSTILDKRGSFHIPGLRLNTVSKILAIHDPSKWPVYNAPVETTLRHFGYKPPRGVGLAGRYEAFAKLMQDFMKECGAKDVCALDWFFYWFAQEKKLSNWKLGKRQDEVGARRIHVAR
jgi:HKD family nuclease